MRGVDTWARLQGRGVLVPSPAGGRGLGRGWDSAELRWWERSPLPLAALGYSPLPNEFRCAQLVRGETFPLSLRRCLTPYPCLRRRYFAPCRGTMRGEGTWTRFGCGVLVPSPAGGGGLGEGVVRLSVSRVFSPFPPSLRRRLRQLRVSPRQRAEKTRVDERNYDLKPATRSRELRLLRTAWG